MSPSAILPAKYPSDVPLLRSCENCRRKKRKCSGDKPTCTRCQAQNECCEYRPTARYFKPARQQSKGGVRKPPVLKKKSPVAKKSPSPEITTEQLPELPVSLLDDTGGLSYMATPTSLTASPQDLLLSMYSPPLATISPSVSIPSDLMNGVLAPTPATAPLLPVSNQLDSQLMVPDMSFNTPMGFCYNSLLDQPAIPKNNIFPEWFV